MLKPDDLQGVEYNPRRMSPEAFDGLKASARTLGDISGICYNKRTGRVFAGIHRVKALKEEYGDDLRIEGADDAPVLVCPARKAAGHRPETPEFRFNIRVVDWPEDLERLANVTANNPHIQGVFDENLEDILGQIGNDFADGLAEDLRIPDLDLDMVIGKTGTGGPGKEGASPAVKPGRPPAPEIHGDDDRAGRFLLVYTSPEERQRWCEKLGFPPDTDKVVWTVDDLDDIAEGEAGAEAGEGEEDATPQ